MVNVLRANSGKLQPSGHVDPHTIFFAKILDGKMSEQRHEARQVPNVPIPELGKGVTVVYGPAQNVDMLDEGPKLLVQNARFSVHTGVTIASNHVTNKLEMGLKLDDRLASVVDEDVLPASLADNAVEIGRAKFRLHHGEGATLVTASLIASNVTPLGGKVAITANLPFGIKFQLLEFRATSADLSIVLSSHSYPGTSFLYLDEKSLHGELLATQNILTGTSPLGAGLRLWIDTTLRGLEAAAMHIIGKLAGNDSVLYKESFVKVEEHTRILPSPPDELVAK